MKETKIESQGQDCFSYVQIMFAAAKGFTDAHWKHFRQCPKCLRMATIASHVAAEPAPDLSEEIAKLESLRTRMTRAATRLQGMGKLSAEWADRLSKQVLSSAAEVFINPKGLGWLVPGDLQPTVQTSRGSEESERPVTRLDAPDGSVVLSLNPLGRSLSIHCKQDPAPPFVLIVPDVEADEPRLIPMRPSRLGGSYALVEDLPEGESQVFLPPSNEEDG